MATVTEPQALITDETGLAIASAISGNNTKVNKSDIAPNFSTDTIYNINDYVYYQSVLYRFTAPHAAGAWTGTDVEAVTIGEEIKNGTGKPDFTGTRSTWESMTVAERKTYKQAIFPNEYEDENITAAQVSFDNTNTGMTATNTQNAITELKSGLTSVENTVDKIPTSGDIWFSAVFTSTAHGGNYFAPLNSLPAHTTATLAAVNELGVGDLTLTDFILAANDEHSQSYIYTANSAHAGKVCSAKITFT